MVAVSQHYVVTAAVDAKTCHLVSITGVLWRSFSVVSSLVSVDSVKRPTIHIFEPALLFYCTY